MANRGSYVEYLVEQLSPLGQITVRAMMGGHTLYCDGVVFALVDDDTVYLKADDKNRPQFEAHGLAAFCPDPAKPQCTMSYHLAPPEIFEDRAALKKWAGGAIEAGRRAKGKRRSPRKANT
ncbi:MAG: TfoX/Sxy family protein [Acidobacteria bacterium]|nr:TfoX/Sxy family protein [Acidobacteriota bacterium]